MRLKSYLLAIPFCLLAFPCYGGAFLSALVANGEVNTFEDQSRETIIDVDQDGALSNGDVIAGFLRLDDRTTPTPGESLPGDAAYLGFAQEVANLTRTVTGGFVIHEWNLVPVSAASAAGGLSFDALTGVGVPSPPNTIGALYEDIAIDLVNTSPGDLNGNGQLDIGDFLRHLQTVGSRVVTAIDTGSLPNFQEATSLVRVGTPVPNDNLAVLDSLPIGSPAGAFFDLGLTLVGNTTNLTFLPVPTIQPSTGLVRFNDVGIVNGDTSGAANANYIDAGLGGLQTNVFSNAVPNTLALTNADHYPVADNAAVLVAAIPEPSSLAIFGIGALAAVRYRRRRS